MAFPLGGKLSENSSYMSPNPFCTCCTALYFTIISNSLPAPREISLNTLPFSSDCKSIVNV